MRPFRAPPPRPTRRLPRVGVLRCALRAGLLAGSVVAPRAGPAQAPLPTGAVGRHAALLAAGWDNGFVADARLLAPMASGGCRCAALTAGLTVPWALAVTGDAWKLAVGVEGTRRTSAEGRLGVQLRSRATLTRAVDPTGRRLAVGLELGAAPGMHTRRATAALDVDWRVTLATHVRHSAMARDLFAERPGVADAAGRAEGPRDGWAAGGGTQVRLGVAGARDVGGTLVLARGGLSHLPNRLGVVANPMLGQLPFHLIVGAAHPW